MSNADNQIKIDAKRIRDHLLALKDDRDTAIANNIDKAEKKPTSISLVKAFLCCAPETRDPSDFIALIAKSAKDQELVIQNYETDDLKEQLLHDWVVYCDRTQNRHLASTSLQNKGMGFIELVLEDKSTSNIRVSLPSAPQTTAASVARPSCDV